MTSIIQRHSAKPFIERKNMSGLVYLIMGSLLCLRGINDVFIYPAILLGGGVILFSNPKIGLPFLFFILPFGTIFKFNPGQISFFTVLFFLYIARQFLLKGIRLKVLIACTILSIYLILCSGIVQSVTILTMIAGIIFVSYSISGENSFKEIILAYSTGLILASMLGLLQDYFPIIKDFVTDVILRLGESERINRFSGLQGNPNYFTIDIIMALSGIGVLLFQEKHIWIYIALFIILTVIGLLSLSKSFLVSWIALICFMIIFIINSRKRKVRRLIFILGGVIGCIYFMASKQINEYVMRFMNSMGSISDLTTGRTDIWLNYISVIWGNIKILFLGNGINGELVNGRGTHNTYIEVLYSLGIVGTIVLIAVLYICLQVNTKKKPAIQYMPLIILLIRFLAIGLLTYDNLWFYLVIAIVSIKTKTSDLKLKTE